MENTFNAKHQFIDEVNINGILCAEVEVWEYTGNKTCFTEVNANLKVGYTEKELEEFLNKLDVECLDTYYQQVYGIVWMKDGSSYIIGGPDGDTHVSGWKSYSWSYGIPEKLKDNGE